MKCFLWLMLLICSCCCWCSRGKVKHIPRKPISFLLVFEIDDRLDLDILRDLEQILFEYNVTAVFFASIYALQLYSDMEKFFNMRRDNFVIGAKVVTQREESTGISLINWQKTHEFCKRIGSKVILVPKDVPVTLANEEFGDFFVLKPDFYCFPQEMHMYKAFNVISIPPYRIRELESGLKRFRLKCDFLTIAEYWEESGGDDTALASAMEIRMNSTLKTLPDNSEAVPSSPDLRIHRESNDFLQRTHQNKTSSSNN
jgi:hypothetical protein